MSDSETQPPENTLEAALEYMERKADEWNLPALHAQGAAAVRIATLLMLADKWQGVHKRFAAELAKGNAPSGVSLASLEACLDIFDNLIPRRNALVHAHPITDKVEGQIVAFQAGPSRPIRDLKWERAHLRTFIQNVDKAACEAGALFDQLR